MQTYIITVKHDAGKIRITTAATSEETAITQVMIAENCPRSAIIDARRKPARNPAR